MRTRDVSRPGASLSVHELSLDAPVLDVPDDRWIPESPTWWEVVALTFAIHVVVDAVIVGAVALALVAFATWGPS